MIDIKRLNARIERIKARGITPITAKESETYTIAYAVEGRGTSDEGLFLTFDEAKKKFAKMNPFESELTRERYNDDIEEFVNVISQGQTTVRGAVNYAYEKGMRTIEASEEYIPEDVYKSLIKLSKKNLIDALQFVGEYMTSKDADYKKYNSLQTIEDAYSAWYDDFNDRRQRGKK